MHLQNPEKCIKCKKTARMECSRCSEYYCSELCQFEDWRDHKAVCYQMPTLRPIRKAFRSDAHSQRSAQGSRSRNPLPVDDAQNNTTTLKLSEIDFELKPRYKAEVNHQFHSDAASKALNDSTLKLDNKSVNTFNPATESVVTSKPQNEAIIISTPSSAWKEHFEPPMHEFFDCIVQFIEELDTNQLWITEVEREACLRKLDNEVNASVKIPCTAKQITAGALVTAPLHNFLYRAEVLEVFTEKSEAVVRLIDYGNEIHLPFGKLLQPIPVMANTKAFGFPVRVSRENVAINIESIITVRLIGSKTADGRLIGELKPKEIKYGLPMELLARKCEVRMIKVFPGGRNGLLQLCVNNDINNALHNFLNTEQGIQYDFEMTPNAKISFIAARTLNGWRRAFSLGYIDERHIFLVYEIDEGCISQSSQVKRLPDQFLSHPMSVFAFTINENEPILEEPVLESTKKLTINLSQSTNVDKNMKTPECTLYANDEKLRNIIVTPFTGNMMDLGAKAWLEPIKDGNIIYITHIKSYAEIFIATISTLQYTKIFNIIGPKCAQYENEQAIAIGDIVAFEIDEDIVTYCRGEVLKLPSTNSGLVNVRNMDTGSSHDVPITKIRIANTYMQYLPIRLQLIELATMKRIPQCSILPNNKAFSLLRECVSNSIQFEVKFDTNVGADLLLCTDNHESLVTQLIPLLFAPSGESNSTTVAESVKTNENTMTAAKDEIAFNTPLPPSRPATPLLHTPSEMAQSAEVQSNSVLPKAIYYIDDVKFSPLPVGTNIMLAVLDTSLIQNGYITVSHFMQERMEEMDKKSKLIHEQGVAASHNLPDYIPTENEFCLALFNDGTWYRAHCISIQDENNIKVSYVDYGNMGSVTKKDVRPITNDLLFPSVANICYIEGFDSPEKKDALVTYISKNILISAVATLNQDGETYSIKLNEKTF